MYFCLLVSLEQLKSEILRVIKKIAIFSDFVFMCINVMCDWRRAYCTNGTRSCLIFLIPGESAGTTQEKTLLGCSDKSCLCSFLESKKCCKL